MAKSTSGADPNPPVRRRSLIEAESDVGWKTWVLRSGLQPWFLLLFLTIDVWVAIVWVRAGLTLLLLVAGAILALIPVLFLEFLLYRYLWFRPHPEDPRPFRRTVIRPVPAGIWTPEGERLRAGLDLRTDDAAARREEFL